MGFWSSWAIPQIPYVFLEMHLLQVSLTTGNLKRYLRFSEILTGICPTSAKAQIFKSLP